MNIAQETCGTTKIASPAAPAWLKASRAIECALLFVGVPSAHALGWLPIPVVVLLLIIAGGCSLSMHRRQRITLSELGRFDAPRREKCKIFVTGALAVLLLTALLWFTKPDALFSLIRDQPFTWAMFMLAYPLVSVLPQELIYRVFFFDRYAPLFGKGPGMVAINTLAFSFGHIIFHNWPAVVLTLIGGWLFANTYRRTYSLLLVTIEHALYGWVVFTIGYGEFLFDKTIQVFWQ